MPVRAGARANVTITKDYPRKRAPEIREKEPHDERHAVFLLRLGGHCGTESKKRGLSYQVVVTRWCGFKASY